jgi:peptidyl-prolyl cis-trans isomerase A (cyclophilin A)
VLDGFVAQTGIAADPALNEQWSESTIKDEPRKHSNVRGTVAFGKSAQPNSASTHIFINYADNSGPLDPQGFAPFAEVVSGMENADTLSRVEYNNQAQLAAEGGMGDFRRQFPGADYIESTFVGVPPPVEVVDYFGPMPTRVVLETTKGNIVLAVHPEWAPNGAAQFLDLVRLGFYDGAPWFRVIDRMDPNNPDAPATPFVAQCGIAADPELNKQWGEANIQDDPVVMGNTRGRIAYGKTDEPNSRSTHIYINFGDNSRLDAKGFAAFAEVVEGMDVADSLYKCEFEDQDALAAPGGMAAFKAMFPEADYIVRAYVEEPTQ